MLNKERLIGQLRKGYSPLDGCPREELNTVFNKTFKPLVDKKDLDFFFEIFETNEAYLRAWGFLGIYNILKDKKIEDEKKRSRLHKIIIDLLNDNREIDYYGGKIEIQTPLRDHHIKRICELDKKLIFEPVYEYIQSSEIKTDEVIGELLENVLSKVPDPRIESIILKHARTVDEKDFIAKFHIINAYENLGKFYQLNEKSLITDIFKHYLNDIEEDQSESTEVNESRKLEIVNRKRRLKENIFKVAAELDLDLEKETLTFLDELTHPYNALKQIAKRYENNERFKSIFLRKLEESENPNFIKDILIAIIVLRNNIKNWKDLIIENLNKYQLCDGDLIEEMQTINFFSDEMLVKFLIEGEDWHLEFIREFLTNNPEILNDWVQFRNEFIKILTFLKPVNESWDKYPNLKKKKELVLKLLVDLEKKDMVEYCLDNFLNLKDSELRKIALFALIKLGNEELWLELKSLLKNNNDAADFFKKFWRSLERREWKFYY